MCVPTLVAEIYNWLYLTKKLIEYTGFWCFDINSGKFKVALIIGAPSNRGSYKTMVACLSFHLSVHPSISSAFSSGIGY